LFDAADELKVAYYIYLAGGDTLLRHRRRRRF
jgi:hypothetical protein